MKRGTILALSLIMLLSSRLEAGIGDKAGTTLGQVLEIGLGSRPIAMGEAFSAIADDLNAVYWNPAGLAQVSRTNLAFSYTKWFEGIDHEFVAGAYPLDDELAAVALSGVIMQVDDIIGRDNNSQLTNKFGAEDKFFSLSFGQMRDTEMDLMWGVNIKWFSQHIEKESVGGWLYDAGVIYKLPDYHLSLAAAVQNLGKRLSFINEGYALPLTFRLGGAYTIKEKNLLLAMDLSKPLYGNAKLNLGVEWQINPILAFRAGYKLSSDDLTSGLSSGFGIDIDRFRLDYAFAPAGEFGNTQRVALNIKLDRD